MHTLQDLSSGALAGIGHLRLNNLGLRQLPAAIFDLADSLEVLDLSGNQLSELPADLHRLHRLRILFASNNPFTELPGALGACAQLEMVGFKACAIEHVPAVSLPPRLRWLILTDNHIEDLPDTLGQRPRLQKLMLSCNRLSTLPDLSHCHRLELLRIAGNRFAEVPPGVLQLPALAWLALAGNPLSMAAEQASLAGASANAISASSLRIGAVLGEGASGHIHQAQDTAGRALALKIFKAGQTSDGSPQSELAAGLHAGIHPHLLTPLARVDGLPEGRLAAALPLLDASYRPLAGPPDFASCTRDVYPGDAVFSPAQAHALIEGIGSALAQLRMRGIVHGDLYAHNVLWNPHSGHALLSDFGAGLLTDGLAPHIADQLLAIDQRAWVHLQAEIGARVRR